MIPLCYDKPQWRRIVMPEVRYAFILRLWLKTESASLPLIGSLQPANSDQVYYFTSLDELLTLLWRVLEGYQPPSDRK
jgi:hypothetical protein